MDGRSRRNRKWRALALAAPALMLAMLALAWAASAAQRSDDAAQSAPAKSLEELFDRLSAADFQVRESATEELITLGESIAAEVRARLDRETDPEARYRIRYVLDNIAPPAQAVLVLRSPPELGLSPGDLVTHANGRRVRKASALDERLRDTSVSIMLRVRGRNGPRDVPVPAGLTSFPTNVDYQAPRGPVIAAALQQFGDGYSEKAYELLRTLPEELPPAELTPAFRAIVAYTAGDRPAALRLLTDGGRLVQPGMAENQWSSPSMLDLSGPGKAPLHLEWELWTQEGPTLPGFGSDPDMRVQRVLVPANRSIDALVRSAELWWTAFRANLRDREDSTPAGNMLAVVGWMLSDLSLLSECQRIIEPRSEILRRSVSERTKWLRVQTDAWTPFLAGDTKSAIDLLFPQASDILAPGGQPPSVALIRNPQVAATIALFLYQTPGDPRVEELLGIVNQPEQPALMTYARWMAFGIEPENEELVYKHLLEILPNLTAAEAARAARWVALLEYARPTPNRDVLAAARERTVDAPDRRERAYGAALIDALSHLTAGRTRDARAALADFAGEPGASSLLAAADYIDEFKPTPGGTPLAAARLGPRGWIIVTRERKLLRVDPRGAATPLQPPSPEWTLCPLTFPWVSGSPDGRAWVYDRRRLVEVASSDAAALRLNIEPEQIEDVERFLRPAFGALADAARAAPVEGGEQGEYWAADIKAHAAYVGDPALRDLALVAPLTEDDRIVHVALRGGPQLLIERPTGRSWSSTWMGEKLLLPHPPMFAPQAAWPQDDAPPIVYLMTDLGLARFEPATETITRIALPGDAPYAPLVPESCPYVRRDPRWVYCARIPREGGRVYRLVVQTGRVEPVDMTNEALPPYYYAIQSRASLRQQVDATLQETGMPPLRELIDDAQKTVAEWRRKLAEPSGG